MGNNTFQVINRTLYGSSTLCISYVPNAQEFLYTIAVLRYIGYGRTCIDIVDCCC
jgi:hypothetical protein